MTLVVPNGAEVIALQEFLNDPAPGNALTLKLYSNNVTPAETDTAATYTEVAGGGYVAKTLSYASWTITGGAPSQATYAAQNYTFTGPTNAPGTIYGYFVVGGDGALRWAERFAAGVTPFTPVNGSVIRITPRLQCS